MFENVKFFSHLHLKYAKSAIMTQKNFDWPIIGGGTIFPRSPRTTRNEKKF